MTISIFSNRDTADYGDPVQFNGSYTPNGIVNIHASKDNITYKIAQATCDAYGSYTVEPNVLLEVGVYSVFACSASPNSIITHDCEFGVSQYSSSIPLTMSGSTCVPHWTCVLPLNGYSIDGCGNMRRDLSCDPPPTHNICQNGTCKEVTGAGTDECTVLNADCGTAIITNIQVTNTGVITISGTGTGTVAIKDNGQEIYRATVTAFPYLKSYGFSEGQHTVCAIGNPGTTDENSMCINVQIGTGNGDRYSCVNGSCVVDNPDGEYSTYALCTVGCTHQHKECKSGICSNVPTIGTDTCTTIGASCGTTTSTSNNDGLTYVSLAVIAIGGAYLLFSKKKKGK